MRLLLSLVGAAGLVASGWICWRATAGTREWREFVALGAQARHKQAEWDRFVLLGRRLFPREGGRPSGTAVLKGPEDRQRILVLFVLRDKCGSEANLRVFDEDRRPLSGISTTPGPCGTSVKAAPERGPWAFDIAKLTPGSPILFRYTLVDDRPVHVLSEDK